MTKKLIAVILLVGLVVACDLPLTRRLLSAEEIQELYKSQSEEEFRDTLKSQQEILKRMSSDEVCKELEEMVASWKERQEQIDVLDYAVECSADPLLMNPQSHYRAFNHVSMVLTFTLASDSLQGDVQEKGRKFAQSLIESVQGDLLGLLRVCSMDIYLQDDKDNLRYSHPIRFFSISDFTQTEDETYLQKLVYEEVQRLGERISEGEIGMDRFGREAQEKELIVHIDLSKLKYDEGMREILTFFSIDLLDIFKEDEEAVRILRSDEIERMNVVFYHPAFLQGEEVSYSYMFEP